MLRLRGAALACMPALEARQSTRGRRRCSKCTGGSTAVVAASTPRPLTASPRNGQSAACLLLPAGRELAMSAAPTEAGVSGAGASDEPCLDAHGFEVPEQLLSKYNATRQSAEGGSASVSWPALLEQAALKGYQSGGPLPPRFVAAVREGVPDAHRANAWLLLSGAARKRDEQPGLYATMLAAGRARGDLEVEEQIDRDLHRTFPGHPALTEPFCQRIKNVLLAYSARNPEVAYCQGMNFVTAAILLFVEEEDSAFWLLSYVVEEVLVDHYVQSMLGHQVDSQVLEQLTLTLSSS